jgi:hypothetical protein
VKYTEFDGRQYEEGAMVHQHDQFKRDRREEAAHPSIRGQGLRYPAITAWMHEIDSSLMFISSRNGYTKR